MSLIDRSKMREDVLANWDLLGAAFLKGFKNAAIKQLFLLKFGWVKKLKQFMKDVGGKHNLLMEKKAYSNKDESFELDPGLVLSLVKMQRAANAEMAKHWNKALKQQKGVKFNRVQFHGVKGEWTLPPEQEGNSTILYLHGGAFAYFSTKETRPFTAMVAKKTGKRILAVDYRLAPEHPFPAGLDDCITAYKYLLEEGMDPKKIIIDGESAGGNLTISTMLKLKRDGIELPAGGTIRSPLTDFTFPDPSMYERRKTDPVLAYLPTFLLRKAYVGDNDWEDPLISPIHGNLEGLPPFLIQVSTAEMLHSDSVRFAKALSDMGGDATLEEYDDMLHAFPIISLGSGIPEVEDALESMARFVKKILKE
ncbi:MAG: alpha/beta hydrolase [Candidatus Hodarchaeota archaeon]